MCANALDSDRDQLGREADHPIRSNAKAFVPGRTGHSVEGCLVEDLIPNYDEFVHGQEIGTNRPTITAAAFRFCMWLSATPTRDLSSNLLH